MSKKCYKYLLVFLSFFSLLFFFAVAHPLFLFDSDDWGYTTFHRHAIINLYEWNPTRILPEILYPFCSKIAAYVIYPFNKNYVSALNIVSSVLLSASVIIYVYLFYRVCKKVLAQEAKTSLMISILFFISHFVFLDAEKIAGNYLFWAHNLSCVYYYTIPSLLNGCMVFLYLLNEQDLYDNTKVHNKYIFGIIIVLLYLAINSNLYQSAIFIIFIATKSLIKLISRKNNLKSNIINNRFELSISLVWLISVIIESRGPRSKASWLGVTDSWTNNLISSLTYLCKTLSCINKFFLPMILICLAYVLYAIIQKDNEHLFLLAQLALSIVVYFLFLVVVNSKVSPDYNGRIDVTFGLWFFIIFTTCISVIMIIGSIKKMTILIPMIILILGNECIGLIPSYSNYNITNLESGTVYEIDQYIVSSIVDASEKDQSNITIRVPQFSEDPEHNWPLSLGVGNSISNCLYTYNVINHKIDVTIIPDPSLNEKYGVQIVQQK